MRAPRALAAALLLAPLAAAGIAVAPAPAAAHQQKLAVSTVAVNARTGRLEVMHQVPVHDAEHALRLRGADLPDVVTSEESRAAFAAYVAERFVMEVDGVPVALSFIGSEIDGGSLWVYQDAEAPPAGAAVAVNSQILTDVWARQENRVNLGGGTEVTTLVFRSGDGFKGGVL